MTTPTFKQLMEITVTEKPLHIQQAEGLRAMADMIEQNPGLADHLRYTSLAEVNIPVSFAADPAGTVAAFIRAGLSAGAKIDKNFSEDWAGAYLRWGPIGLHVYAKREQICERVVVGTETVTKTVKDPDALAAVPEIEVTETVEQFEWRCLPLLASTREADRV